MGSGDKKSKKVKMKTIYIHQYNKVSYWVVGHHSAQVYLSAEGPLCALVGSLAVCINGTGAM